MKNIQRISALEKQPELVGENILLLQSDSAKYIVSVEAQELIKYNEPEKQFTEFPQGILVVHFSTYPDTLSKISANYAIHLEEKELWEAKGNVIAKNEKNEVLNTEFLVWDQAKRIIYSHEKVKVTTENDIILGEGFESDEQFDNWKIKKVTGIFTIEE